MEKWKKNLCQNRTGSLLPPLQIVKTGPADCRRNGIGVDPPSVWYSNTYQGQLC